MYLLLPCARHCSQCGSPATIKAELAVRPFHFISWMAPTMLFIFSVLPTQLLVSGRWEGNVNSRDLSWIWGGFSCCMQIPGKLPGPQAILSQWLLNEWPPHPTSVRLSAEPSPYLSACFIPRLPLRHFPWKTFWNLPGSLLFTLLVPRCLLWALTTIEIISLLNLFLLLA
jgi:hypothetical protein